jgi:thioredoxin-dependent peroxiredoxin
MLAEGTKAPDFTLPDQEGNMVSLSDLRGRWVVLWWFPKAFTSGCTVEGQVFRDRAPEIEGTGAMILGASFDTPEENRGFAELHAFPFRLLSDEDRTAGEAYETKRGPEEDHNEYAKRRTYLIDPDGIVVRAYRVTDIPHHPDEVLGDIRALQAEREAQST